MSVTLTGAGFNPPANSGFDKPRAGVYATSGMHQLESGVNQSGAVILWASAVTASGQTNQRDVVPLTAQADVQGFRGLVLRDDPITDGKLGHDHHGQMIIVTKGDLYVELGASVVGGDAVGLPAGGPANLYEPGSATNITIPGAIFRAAGNAGDVVAISIA